MTCPLQQKAQGQFPHCNGAAHANSAHSFHNKYSSSPCAVIEDGALATSKDLGYFRALQKPLSDKRNIRKVGWLKNRGTSCAPYDFPKAAVPFLQVIDHHKSLQAGNSASAGSSSARSRLVQGSISTCVCRAPLTSAKGRAALVTASDTCLG